MNEKARWDGWHVHVGNLRGLVVADPLQVWGSRGQRNDDSHFQEAEVGGKILAVTAVVLRQRVEEILQRNHPLKL